MGRTERAPKHTAGLQGVQGGLSPEWSTRGKELMPTERCQTLPCAAARARSGVGKSLLIRRGKTNAPQRPSENHRASQGWGLSTAPPMAAPAYKQGQPPNPGGCSGRALQSCVDPPGPPMQTALSSAGPFPALRVAPHGTWGAAALHLHLYGGPDPLGWGLIAMGTQLRVTPPSRPTQPQRSGAPTQRLAVGRRTPSQTDRLQRGRCAQSTPTSAPPMAPGSRREPRGGTQHMDIPAPPPRASVSPQTPNCPPQPLRQQLRRALRTPHSHPMDGDRPVRGSGHFPYNAAFGQTTPRGAPGGEPKPQSSARPPGRAVGRRCPSLTSSPRRAPHPKRSSSPGGQHCEPATSMAPRRGHREDGYGALIATTPRSGAAFGVAELFGAAALFGAVGPGALFHRGCEWAPATPPPVASTNGIAGA